MGIFFLPTFPQGSPGPLFIILFPTREVEELAAGSWASGAFVSLVDATFTLRLPYRGNNVINHFFCEPPALLKLASADTYSTEMAIFAMGVVILLAPVSLILTSYWNIVSTVIQMQSGEGRLKVFSTCGSHLSVVTLFYGTIIGLYLCPSGNNSTVKGTVMAMMYTVVTPMLNPFIYSLRNRDMKGALISVLCKKKILFCL